MHRRATPGFGRTPLRTIEHVMRVMTHVNIGATLGMASWLLWSGHLVVSGQWKIPQGHPVGTQTQTSASRQPVELPCCFVPAGDRPAEPRVLQARSRPDELLARAELRSAP